MSKKLTKKQLKQKAIKLQSQEIEKNDLCWWYVSFASEKGFLGAIVIKAFGIVDASIQSWKLGINPGGEAMFIRVPSEDDLPAEEYRNRLLSVAEMEKAGMGPKDLRQMEEEGLVPTA